jgi:hypothetical protein
MLLVWGNAPLRFTSTSWQSLITEHQLCMHCLSVGISVNPLFSGHWPSRGGLLTPERGQLHCSHSFPDAMHSSYHTSVRIHLSVTSAGTFDSIFWLNPKPELQQRMLKAHISWGFCTEREITDGGCISLVLNDRFMKLYTFQTVALGGR